MSIINSDGKNTDWQLKVLRGLQATTDAIKASNSGSGSFPSTQITPNLLIETGISAIIQNIKSVSFANIGTADGLLSFDGGITMHTFPKGATVSMDAGGFDNFYTANIFRWDATGTTFMITFNL